MNFIVSLNNFMLDDKSEACIWNEVDGHIEDYVSCRGIALDGLDDKPLDILRSQLYDIVFNMKLDQKNKSEYMFVIPKTDEQRGYA